jgi:stage IV sporulation protein FB
MSWSVTLGTVAGTQLRVHATFFLLLVWIVVAGSIAEGLGAALENAVLIIAIFACVVLHEFGHAAMARRFGIKTPDITLLPIGGMARLERFPEAPREEILIAIAGPAVNVMIWFVLTFFLNANVSLGIISSLEDPSETFLARLASVNLVLVVFNMIPAFPMDGGRIFRAALAMFMDRARATSIAASMGQIMAFLFGFLGLIGGSPILVLIAIFIFFAAGAEGADASLRSIAKNAKARDAMISLFETVTPEQTLEATSRSVIRTTQAEFPVLDHHGRFLGFLTRNAILSAPEHARSGIKVQDRMISEAPIVAPDAPMKDVLDAMSLGSPPAVAVTDRNGIFLGYITRENIGEWYLVSHR